MIGDFPEVLNFNRLSLKLNGTSERNPMQPDGNAGNHTMVVKEKRKTKKFFLKRWNLVVEP